MARRIAVLDDAGIIPVENLPQAIEQLPPPLVEELATQDALTTHEATPHGGQAAHAADHASGGTDAITPAAIGADTPHAHPFEPSGAVSTHAGTVHGTQPHAVSGVSHTGTLDHSALSNQTANQHHAQAHAVSGADHSGSLVIGQIPTGQTGTTVPFGNDARFSDARTPLAHAHAPVYANLGTGLALALATNEVVKITPSATGTLTTTVPAAGYRRTVVVVQTNTTAKTMTFGSGFKPVATLVLGTTANRQYSVEFVSDGVALIETSRTAAIIV